MLRFLFKDKKVVPSTILFILLVAYWAYINLTHQTGVTGHAKIFGAIYGLVALYGGVFGVILSKKWGGFKSLIGKAIIFLSLGLLAQEFGQLAYTYLGLGTGLDDIPYPSIGDIGYFGSIPLYSLGAFYLLRSTGSNITLKTTKNKLIAIILPVILLATSYTIFLRGYEFDWSHPLTVFLDFGYPLGQAIYISLGIIAFLLSRKLLGGIMRPRILLIIFALFMQYVSDFTFLYQNQHETWVPAGINDLIYLTAYFIMTIAILNLGGLLSRLQSPASTELEQTEQGSGDSVAGGQV
jgi:hypothetical protein